MAAPDFWNSPPQAQALVAELKQLKNLLGPLPRFEKSRIDLFELFEMAETESDEGYRRRTDA